MTNNEECLFCKIIQGEIPSTKVFEDDKVLAFMDIYPVSEGHCLLIPKDHYANMFDVDKDVLAHLSKRLADLTRMVNRAFKPDGVLNTVANGPGAGQEIPHLHFHVIPRNKGDEFGFRFPDGYREKMASQEDLKKIASKITEAI
ncbi:MAG: HIT domain-containing protein [Candidatus Lokiarchaeota archaeon]|nr:HIT domain-containing protein [Candidatus Lokiarchaeota archaeon]